MPESLPGARWATGKEALADLLEGAIKVRGAVAFVTNGGVGILADLLTGEESLEVCEIVARGAPVTDPDALIRLRDELKVDVSVVAEREAMLFHPKLWLIETASEMRVLSGSGNLTGDGLTRNREQFEAYRVDAGERQAQHERFDHLTAGAIPLERFEDSLAWRKWREQAKQRRALAGKIAALDDELAAERADNREADKKALADDLWEIYKLALGAKLEKLDGDSYNPSGLRMELEGHWGSGEPVKTASNLCKKGTDGFDELARHDRLDLTVEFLVADPNKPYHSLFRREIRELAADRLHEAEDKGCTAPAVARAAAYGNG